MFGVVCFAVGRWCGALLWIGADLVLVVFVIEMYGMI